VTAQIDDIALSPVYLDHQSSTPLDPRVISAMVRHEELYGNPHTTSHLSGIEANRAVILARRKVARAINGDARRVVFTSGATEANNLAVFGVTRAAIGRRKVVTTVSEHSSVLEPVNSLREEGYVIELVPVQADGIVDLTKLSQVIDTETALVSVMHVNNETGVIQPISKIADLCHSVGALLHSDCAQSLGKLHLDIHHLKVDLLTLSAHKAYGPKGIGALYVGGNPKVTVKPLYLGGGQESGLRPGTLPVPLCIGFGEACQIAAEEVEEDAERMRRLAEVMVNEIRSFFPKLKLNGSVKHRAPGAFNICFPGTTGDELLSAFHGIEVSSGSACLSTSIEPSRILLAYGLSAADADASLRLCIGRFTTSEDIHRAISIIRRGLLSLGVVNAP